MLSFRSAGLLRVTLDSTRGNNLTLDLNIKHNTTLKHVSALARNSLKYINIIRTSNIGLDDRLIHNICVMCLIKIILIIVHVELEEYVQISFVEMIFY